MRKVSLLLLTGLTIYGCKIGSTDFGDPIGEYKSDKDISPRVVAGFPWFSKYKNPTAYIPLECYTDTGKALTGKAFANPCYVCHNGGNTPVDNAGDWENQINWLRFPSDDNPWLNAVAPEKTFEKILDSGKKWTELDLINKVVKDNKENKTVHIDSWIRQNNWEIAYQQTAKLGSSNLLGLGEYALDIPPLYRWNGTSFERTGYIDSEGFIYSSETDHTDQTNTWWRAYDWKHFPGFFPTNGRLDSAMIRLPEKFRKKDGQYNKDIYKINLAILECSIKQITKNCDVEPLNTDILDSYNISYQKLTDGIRFLKVPERYVGDASNIDVWQTKPDGTKVGLYPVGTELGHPVYYIDPDWENRPYLGGKTGQLKEFRYMKKLVMQDLSVSGEEEESISYPPYDNGLMLNDPGTWLMGGWIEDKNGNLRPQSEEEMAFCIACHGAISGTVDNTFSFWRKLPKSAGWKDTDYGYNRDNFDLKYWADQLSNIEDQDASIYLGTIYGKYDPKDYNEYQLYFTMTNGIDHFRSNKEGVCRIFGYRLYDKNSDACKETALDPSATLSFNTALNYLKITSDTNILTDKTLIGYLNNNGSIKQELFLPSKEKAYSLDGRYIQVVLSQQFVYGRDLFGEAFGTKDGGNSLEEEDFYNLKLSDPGLEEKGLIAVFKTLLGF
ncbi:hypothetical protein [Persephonella sp.]